MHIKKQVVDLPADKRVSTNGWYRSWGKRVLDVSVATIALVVCVPLILLLALLVRLQLGSPVFFRQNRPGLYGKPFLLTKFRTMTDERDNVGNLMPDDVRLTRFGRFLRSTSLDELPELLNVLAGEMSLVGPRPLLMQYLERYSEEQMRRHDVLPGITGLAQVNGRNALSWEEKFAHDLWYVDTMSFRLDMRILLQTVLIALRRENISQEGVATVEEFKGSGDG